MCKYTMIAQQKYVFFNNQCHIQKITQTLVSCVCSAFGCSTSGISSIESSMESFTLNLTVTLKTYEKIRYRSQEQCQQPPTPSY